jgi:hypothetical protein
LISQHHDACIVLHNYCRYHGKALLVTFQSSNDTQQHIDALTKELQKGFKRLDKDIRELAPPSKPGELQREVVGVAGEDDREVRRACGCRSVGQRAAGGL